MAGEKGEIGELKDDKMDKEELLQDFVRYIKEVYHTDKNQEMLEQIFALLKSIEGELKDECME